MAELKPCPFCGNPAYDHISYHIHAHKQRHIVKCTKCNASMEYRDKKSAIKAWNTRTPKVSEKEFDYGMVIYKHRFNMTRSIDDYKETALNKCIRIGLELKYKTMACDKLVYEMQIVYKDENDKLQCICFDLHDWTVAIKHIGNMQCNI